jgi:tRNA(Ile)-lysidine synthase
MRISDSRIRMQGGAQALQGLRDDGSVGVLDADLLSLGELTVRAWRAGDRLRALGAPGTKTLADLFTDRRVPRAERGRIPVVLCAGEIVWIPGIATADRVRVRDATERVAVLTARRA